jgi:DNA-binding NtrC family response regulator
MFYDCIYDGGKSGDILAKIAVIDSDRDFRDLVDEVLSELGHEVIGLPKSDDAPTAVRDSDADLIIIDILMDGPRKGFKTLTAIKDDPETARTPVIASTPLDTKEIDVHRTELQPLLAGILFKPFDMEALERLVTDVLKSRSESRSSTSPVHRTDSR